MLNYWSTKPLLNVNVEQTKDVHMYIEEFILVEIWIHCCTSWNLNWISIGRMLVLYTLTTKGMRYVRITLRCTIDTVD